MKAHSRNGYFLAAAAITGLATLIHGIGGEIVNMRPMLAADLDPTTQIEIWGVWHGYTILLAGSTWMLLQMAAGRPPSTDLSKLLVGFYLLNGLVWLGFVIATAPDNLLNTPQWFILLLVGALIVLGERRNTQKEIEQ